jgi:hypothetical protein
MRCVPLDCLPAASIPSLDRLFLQICLGCTTNNPEQQGLLATSLPHQEDQTVLVRFWRSTIMQLRADVWPGTQPTGLMEDQGLDASSISMDHDAMLSSNPKKNAAFMRVFGNYVGGSHANQKLKSAPQAATQLAESSGSSNGKGGGLKSENQKLAQQMQAELTAGSDDEESFTPHCERANPAATAAHRSPATS